MDSKYYLTLYNATKIIKIIIDKHIITEIGCNLLYNEGPSLPLYLYSSATHQV